MTNIKFGTDGWRAVIAEDFTFENLGFVVKAISAYLKKSKYAQKGVFIGYDNRFLSEEFAAFCAELFSKSSIRTFTASVSIPTPVTAFMTVKLGLGGSIMLTASHNPAKYNGIKFIPFYGGPANENITSEIECNLKEIVEKNTGKDLNANENDRAPIEYISDFESYKLKIMEIIDHNLIIEASPLIAADTMHGAGSVILPEILKEKLNLEPLLLNTVRDALFGGKLPDPSEKNLKELKDTVIENKLDIGLALDGDADRFGAIDGKGCYISANNAIALILYHFIERKKYKPGDIAVRTVATTHLIDRICSSAGIETVETPVGFKYIAEKMLDGNVIIGGEESGGISVKGHIPEKDGLLAGLLLTEIQSYLKVYRGSIFISDYLEEIYKKYGHYYNKRLDIEVEAGKKDAIIDYFKNIPGGSISGAEVKKNIDIDGSKVILENDSWILVRGSGTEPLIRCYIESKDSDFLQKLENQARKIISEI